MALDVKQQIEKNVAAHVAKGTVKDASKAKAAAGGKSDDEFSRTVGDVLADQKKGGKMVTRNPDDEMRESLPDGKGAAVFTKEQLVKFKETIEAALQKRNRSKEGYDRDKAAVTTAYNNAAKAGIPKDELKFIVEKHSSFDDDFKQGVGALEEMLGLQPTFHFEEPEGFDAVKH